FVGFQERHQLNLYYNSYMPKQGQDAERNDNNAFQPYTKNSRPPACCPHPKDYLREAHNTQGYQRFRSTRLSFLVRWAKRKLSYLVAFFIFLRLVFILFDYRFPLIFDALDFF